MAMTNEQLIIWGSMDLVAAGVIGTTGRMIDITDAMGITHHLPEPEPIHTFAAWKARGYIVRKGEKSIATIRIWKYKARKVTVTNKDGEEEEKETGDLFMKDAFFFKRSQVEKIS